MNNSCVLYCAAVSEKYEDQSQRNPYVTLSRLAPHFEDEIAGLQKRPFLAGFELFGAKPTLKYSIDSLDNPLSIKYFNAR